MYLIFDKQTKNLVDWVEQYERNTPEDSDIHYEDAYRIVIFKPDWTPGTVTIQDDLLVPENDVYITKRNEIRPMTRKRKNARRSKALKSKYNEEINRIINRKIMKLSQIPVGFLIEMKNIGELLKAGKTDEIDPNFSVVANHADDYIEPYRRIMPKLFRLYRLKMRFNRLKNSDLDPDELTAAYQDIKKTLDSFDDTEEVAL